MPRERVANKKFDVNTGVLSIEFLGKAGSDGKRPITETVKATAQDFGVPKEVYDKLPTVARQTFGNGMSQKLGDAYADSEDGSPAQNVKELLSQIKGGTWAQRGGGGERTSFLLQALVEVTKQDESTVRSFLDGLSDEQRKELPKDPQVEPVIARLRREAAAKAEAEAKQRAATAGAAGKPSLLAGLVKATAKK